MRGTATSRLDTNMAPIPGMGSDMRRCRRRARGRPDARRLAKSAVGTSSSPSSTPPTSRPRASADAARCVGPRPGSSRGGRGREVIVVAPMPVASWRSASPRPTRVIELVEAQIWLPDRARPIASIMARRCRNDPRSVGLDHRARVHEHGAGIGRRSCAPPCRKDRRAGPDRVEVRAVDERDPPGPVSRRAADDTSCSLHMRGPS